MNGGRFYEVFFGSHFTHGDAPQIHKQTCKQEDDDRCVVNKSSGFRINPAPPGGPRGADGSVLMPKTDRWKFLTGNGGRNEAPLVLLCWSSLLKLG